MKRSAWWNLLLLVPFIATLFPALYNKMDPPLWGMPFFYWYQLVWTVGAGIVLIVYIAIVGGGKRDAG
jgi:hypothetical protein